MNDINDNIRPASRIPRNRPPLWDIETLVELAKGAIALVLIGIATGLVMISGRVLWDVSDEYAHAVAVWISELF